MNNRFALCIRNRSKNIFSGVLMTLIFTFHGTLCAQNRRIAAPAGSLSAPQNQAAPTWKVVGSAGFSPAGARDIHLSFNGSTPYVAYKDFAKDGKATVMRFNGTTWETVGNAGFSYGESSFTTLAFLGSTPYVAFQDHANEDKITVMKCE